METTKISKNGCKLIAHRGLSAFAPENTMAAFRLAANASYYGIECDVHVTKDGRFVVFHDFDLERMCHHVGFIKEMTYEELSKITIKNGNYIEQYSNEKIPLLEDFLQLCRDNNKVPVIEVKDINQMSDLDHLLKLLEVYNLVQKAIVISFVWKYLYYLREKSDDLTMQLVTKNINYSVIQKCKKYHLDVDGYFKRITKHKLKQCHKHNLLVNTYTVDHPLQAYILIQNGIDFITTNCLE
jgi:glycerophosphoryl diester phosphodiesterase